MKMSVMALLPTLALLLATGCDIPTAQTQAEPSVPTAKEDHQAVAKEKLKIALDAWTFGDSAEKFKADHPDILFPGYFDFGRPAKLLRYEIGAGRPWDTGYEFAVTIVFASARGEEKQAAKNFKVFQPGSKGPWHIAGATDPAL